MSQEDEPGTVEGAEDQLPEEEAFFLRQPRRDGDNIVLYYPLPTTLRCT